MGHEAEPELRGRGRLHPDRHELVSSRGDVIVARFVTPAAARVERGREQNPRRSRRGHRFGAELHSEEALPVAKYDLPATPFAVPESPRTGGHEYVWHCHILEHEEHDMMRPLVIT